MLNTGDLVVRRVQFIDGQYRDLQGRVTEVNEVAAWILWRAPFPEDWGVTWDGPPEQWVRKSDENGFVMVVSP